MKGLRPLCFLALDGSFDKIVETLCFREVFINIRFAMKFSIKISTISDVFNKNILDEFF